MVRLSSFFISILMVFITSGVFAQSRFDELVIGVARPLEESPILLREVHAKITDNNFEVDYLLFNPSGDRASILLGFPVLGELGDLPAQDQEGSATDAMADGEDREAPSPGDTEPIPGDEAALASLLEGIQEHFDMVLTFQGANRRPQALVNEDFPDSEAGYFLVFRVDLPSEGETTLTARYYQKRYEYSTPEGERGIRQSFHVETARSWPVETPSMDIQASVAGIMDRMNAQRINLFNHELYYWGHRFDPIPFEITDTVDPVTKQARILFQWRVENTIPDKAIWYTHFWESQGVSPSMAILKAMHQGGLLGMASSFFQFPRSPFYDVEGEIDLFSLSAQEFDEMISLLSTSIRELNFTELRSVSNYRVLQDIKTLVRFAINGINARNGARFNNGRWSDFFENYSWYQASENQENLEIEILSDLLSILLEIQNMLG